MGSSGAATAAGRRRAGTAKRRPAAKRPAKRPGSASARKRRAKPRSRAAAARPRTANLSWSGWRVRLLALVALLAALAGAYLLWFRDSSLVAVSDVEVVGVQSGDRDAIVAELTRAAEGMSTLNLHETRLQEAVAGFPTVESVSADADFPHGLTIQVAERPPKVVVRNGEREAAIAADGRVLPGVAAPEDLPALELDEVPSAGRLGGEPLEQALVAGAAPAELAPLIEEVSYDDELGVEVILRGGIPVRFGTGARAREKWQAAAAVLADPKLDSLTYLDVRVPERPATGGA